MLTDRELAPARAEDDRHGALRDAVHQAEHCVALLRVLSH
jgi:hypothetical protein